MFKKSCRIILLLMICMLMFSMISVSAAKDAAKDFDDVSKKDWFYKSVNYAYNNNLFTGTTPTTFGPNENMNRGMFVTVLGRLHGVSSKGAKTKFSDVKKSDYFSGYVAWASKNGIVNGTGATTFSPNANITREQICAMMVRYCDYADVTLKKVNKAIKFSDAKKISSYAKKAVSACQQGAIVNGKGKNMFDPQGNATRCEVATILMNFCNNYKNDTTPPDDDPSDVPDNPTDEPDDGGIDLEIGVGPGTLPGVDENW